VAVAIDEAVAGPVLVVGSLPPDGRDLDLLAEPDECTAIRSWLEGAGFVPWGHTWARLAEPGGYAVELLTTERWRTRRRDASALFADAVPIAGFRHLVRPGPAGVLLLAARSTVIRRGRVSEKIRRRVSQALTDDPDAWAVAEERARDLGMVGAVRLLHEAYNAGQPLPGGARAVALCGLLLHDGPLAAKVRILASIRPRRVKPAIVSFSGLDGSGKTTQVTRLQDHLRQLGVDSERQWAGFKAGRKLRGALPILDGRLPGQRTHEQPDSLVPTRLLNSHLGRQAWAFVVVGGNTLHLWRLVLRRRPGTKLVIFDRFSPDTMVKLDLAFVRKRHIDIPWQRRLFARISPKPDVSFLVDVSSEVAYSRRQEQTPEELATMSELYQEQIARFRLHRLDGTKEPAVLADQVVHTTWRGLQ